MAIAYIVGALIIVFTHITVVPAAFAAIFKGAFGLKAAGGGVLGYGINMAITWGFKRGAFSNEAGLGSSVMVHSSSNVKEPVSRACGASLRSLLTPSWSAPSPLWCCSAPALWIWKPA